MVLDGITLQNLDVLECASGTFGDRRECSLLGLVDRCVTPFGRRLLRQWLCMPLLHAESIRERQEAIAEATQLLDMELGGLELPGGRPSRGAQSLSLRRFLQHLPDLERLLCRLHIWGVTVRDNKGKVVERAGTRSLSLSFTRHKPRERRLLLSSKRNNYQHSYSTGMAAYSYSSTKYFYELLSLHTCMLYSYFYCTVITLAIILQVAK